MTDEPARFRATGKVTWWTTDENGIPNHPPVHLGDILDDGIRLEAPPRPETPITWDSLAAIARTLPEPPPARRLEVGPGVADYLRRTAPAPASPAPPDLWAIPVVEVDGIPCGGWRIVEADGVVRTAGLIGSALLEER